MCSFDSNDSVFLFSENKYDDDDDLWRFCRRNLGKRSSILKAKQRFPVRVRDTVTLTIELFSDKPDETVFYISSCLLYLC